MTQDVTSGLTGASQVSQTGNPTDSFAAPLAASLSPPTSAFGLRRWLKALQVMRWEQGRKQGRKQGSEQRWKQRRKQNFVARLSLYIYVHTQPTTTHILLFLFSHAPRSHS